MSQAHSAHVSFHCYRLSMIAIWPDSECKQAALAAARAAYQGGLAIERAAALDGPTGPRLK